MEWRNKSLLLIKILVVVRLLGIDFHASLEGGNLLTDAVFALLQVERALLQLLGRVLGDGGSSLWLALGIRTNGFMRLCVHCLDGIRSDARLDKARELALEAFRRLFLKLTHVIGNVRSENVLTEDLSINSARLLVESGEALLRVRNVQAAVDGAFHGGKNFGSGGGATETDIKARLEGVSPVLLVKFHRVDAEGGQAATRTQQPSAIGSGIVGQTDGDAVAGKFVSICRGEDQVSLDLCIDNLADDVGIGQADDQAVLGGVVLCLVLDYKALTSIVVGLAFAASAVLDLETLEVGLVFDFL